ncbi:MAG: hypothetical protein LBL69_01640 [Zoogloeaceae bacterium]|jgi:hypothetical protein|nr:hypothetical protein [Zoogloeaceae bacterium]
MTTFLFSSLSGLVFLLLLGIAGGFLLRFVWPANRLLRELARAVRFLTALRAENAQPDPQRIAENFLASPRFAPLWRSYAQSLSPRIERESGQARWFCSRPAERFFSETTLIDLPLKTGFYQHLPGILTGIGIIGTFAGLISGLTQFNAAGDVGVVRASLSHLITGVGHAFYVSALAISLAMLFTWIEKSLVTQACRRLAALNALLDDCFESVREESQIARLVRLSETSVQQNKTLIEALSRQQENLGLSLGNSLAEPIADLRRALAQVAQTQSEAAKHSLDGLLERFSERLGQQLATQMGQGGGRLETALTGAASALQAGVSAFSEIAGRLDRMGVSAVESAAGELRGAGQGVHLASEGFADASARIVEAARLLSEASRETQARMADEAASRQAFAQLLGDLRATVDKAGREAALTPELIAGLERASHALSAAQKEADAYLEGVNQVLTAAHARFAENVERTLRQGNLSFQQELEKAVDSLKNAVSGLGDTMETLQAAA